MRRLKRVAEGEDLVDVKQLLQRVDEASDNLRDIYYVLFDNLNALYESYPALYKQIEMVVKLPTNDNAKDIVDFRNGLHDILQHFQDDEYLVDYVKPMNEGK